MRPHAVLILTVGLTPELCALAAESARVGWGSSDVVAFSSIGELLRRRLHPESVEIVLLGGTIPVTDLEAAAHVAGDDGLPRWPVLTLGEYKGSSHVIAVPREMQTVVGLTFALTLGVKYHAVARDAQRAHGDLWTIARRISHEIRSPVGCIMTSADVIREEMVDLVPAAGALAQPIMDSAREVMDLIERLTLIARASAIPPEPATVEMGMVVWAVRERLMARINETQATIVEPGEWPAMRARTEWIEAMWLNLLSNALQHGGPRPKIELGWRRDEGEVTFFVRDHGPGVAADVEPMLLRPFHLLYRHDSGRGLGLAIVQRLAELEGGRAGYEPVMPRGSCFYFSLPDRGTTAESA